MEKVEVGVGALREGRCRRGLVRVRRLQSSSFRPATCMVVEAEEEVDEDEDEDDEEEDNDEAVLEKAEEMVVVMVLAVLGVAATLRRLSLSLLLSLPLLSGYLSSLLLFFLLGLSLSFFEGLVALEGR